MFVCPENYNHFTGLVGDLNGRAIPLSVQCDLAKEAWPVILPGQNIKDGFKVVLRDGAGISNVVISADIDRFLHEGIVCSESGCRGRQVNNLFIGDLCCERSDDTYVQKKSDIPINLCPDGGSNSQSTQSRAKT